MAARAGELLERMRRLTEGRGQIVHVETMEQRPPRFGSLSRPISARLQERLAEDGIESLFAHQARAVERVRQGEHVVVVTGTASGKSLCYQIPVLEALEEDPAARALLLFPTKALAQDQLKVLRRLLAEEEGARSPRAGTYDGDTPTNLRTRLRDEANLLLTNPDMLHSGILPHHARWSGFFSRLQYVVVDEIHVYRGIFGSHVANVLRRLRRIAAHYGADPIFICASATIANPGELASRLIGAPVTVVDEDGSPRGRKHFVFWNPPRAGEMAMERRSSNLEARDLLVELIKDGYQTIAFVKARLLTEVLLRYCQEALREAGGGLAAKLRAYRAGYLASERRKIEAALFNGELRGVISTNALELGIDVGSLDAAILVGYPGTIASTWQQAGRAGRRQSESVAILVGHNAPIDQYLMQNPDYFFRNNPENAILDPGNPHILLNHLRCAAFEIPIPVPEEGTWGEYAPAILDLLQDRALVRQVKGRWFYASEDYPAATFSLRNSGENEYTIIDTSETNRVIGTIDEPSAFTQVHPQAVYLHDAETYLVDSLDLSERIVYLHKTDVDYYTQAVTDSYIDAADPELERSWAADPDGSASTTSGNDERKPAPTVALSFGECSIHEKVTMFKKIKFGSRDSLGYGQVDLPHWTLRTTALWFVFSAPVLAKALQQGRVPADGLTGIANVLAEVVSLHVMCDPHDLGTAVDMRNTGGPTVFLYDKYPGGLGYAQRAFHRFEEMLAAALRLIEGCPCEDGCPSCVGSPLPASFHQDPDAFSKGRIPDKEAALILLHAALGREEYRARVPLQGIRARRAEALAARAGEEQRAVPDSAQEKVCLSGSDDRVRGVADTASGTGGRGGASAPLPREVRPLPEDLRRKLVGQIERLKENTVERRRRSFPTQRVGATD